MVRVKILYLGENFGFKRNFGFRSKILGLGKNFGFGLAENFGFGGMSVSRHVSKPAFWHVGK